MCGFAGVIGPQPPSHGRVERAHASLRHRGPDGDGRWQGTLDGSSVTLLHQRLAIIDLDPRSDQPMERDGCVLAFNGEIYNYLELRNELRGLGHHFATDSDTEVVLEAYRRWGTDCVDRFEGMWALALVDTRQGLLWLSRDRFGEKPLFCWFRRGTLYFASEIKALAALASDCPAPNLDQIRRYLVNGYKALHKSRAAWYRDITAIPPGASAIIHRPQEPVSTPYWRPVFAPREMSAADAVEGVRERLFRATELRLRADVPVAFCLSGGIDSGTLAGIACHKLGHAIHAFSIVDRDPRYDERDTLMKTVAELDCRHHVVHISSDGFFDRMRRLVRAHDAPVATVSYYVHDFLSEAISAHGYKVAISGTGADELFTGYYDHYGFWLAGMSGSDGFAQLVDDWRAGYGATVRNPYLRDPMTFVNRPLERRHIYLDRDVFNALLAEPLDEDFAEESFCDDVLRNRMLNELTAENVPVILEEDDLNSMRWSVENRSPFLDRELTEFAFTIPSRHLIGDGMAKWVLRQAARGMLPDAVRLDRRKRGFNASIETLVDTADPDTREALLAPSPIFDVVDRDRLAELLDGSFKENSYSKFLFSFISARLFLENDAHSDVVEPIDGR